MILEKRILLLSVVVGLIIVLPSCTKNYVCKCENTNTLDGSTHTSYINMERRNKKIAETDCFNMGAHWSVIRECSLN